MNKIALEFMGRFGNQIFQYAFIKIFAKVHNLQVETTPWIGQQLFKGCNDPCPSMGYKNHVDTGYDPNAIWHINLRDRMLIGYFLYHTSFYAKYKEYFKSLFVLNSNIQQSMKAVIDRFNGKDVVAIHLRRGDFVGNQLYYVAEPEWYLDWLNIVCKNAVLYIASDNPEQVSFKFKGFNHLSSKDFNNNMLIDFYIMTQAKCLGISDSTFSFAASMLNSKSEVFMRPLRSGKIIQYDPWNSEVQLGPRNL